MLCVGASPVVLLGCSHPVNHIVTVMAATIGKQLVELRQNSTKSGDPLVPSIQHYLDTEDGPMHRRNHGISLSSAYRSCEGPLCDGAPNLIVEYHTARTFSISLCDPVTSWVQTLIVMRPSDRGYPDKLK